MAVVEKISERIQFFIPQESFEFYYIITKRIFIQATDRPFAKLGFEELIIGRLALTDKF